MASHQLTQCNATCDVSAVVLPDNLAASRVPDGMSCHCPSALPSGPLELSLAPYAKIADSKIISSVADPTPTSRNTGWKFADVSLPSCNDGTTQK